MSRALERPALAAIALDAPRIAVGVVLPAVALAFAVRIVWLVLAVVHGHAPIENEGGEYARLAENLRSGVGYVGLRGVFHAHNPPLYSLLIAALAPLLDGPELAGRLISVVAGSLLVVPVAELGARAYGPRAGAAAAFLVAVDPFLIGMSTSVFSETLFVALGIGAAALLARSFGPAGARAALAAGVLFGLAYLTRQEGMLWAAAATLVAFAVAWRRAGVRSAILRGAAVAVPVALLAAPYLIVVAQQTGHFAVFNKTSGNWLEGRRIMSGMRFEQASLLLGPHLEPLGLELSDYPFREPYAGPRSVREAVAFAAFAAPRHLRMIAWYLRQPAFGSYAILAAIAFGLLAPPFSRRRLAGDALVLGALAVVLAGLVSTMLLEPRYLTEIVPWTLLWAGRGVAVVAGPALLRPRAKRAISLALGLLAVATVAVQAERVGAAERNCDVDRAAGAWIGAHVPHAVVMDQGTAIPFYAGARRWITFPWADGATAGRYVEKQRPDVLVIVGSTAADLPYLAQWLRQGIPVRGVERAAVVRTDGDLAAIYLWRR